MRSTFERIYVQTTSCCNNEPGVCDCDDWKKFSIPRRREGTGNKFHMRPVMISESRVADTKHGIPYILSERKTIGDSLMGLKIYCPTEFRHLCRVSLFYLKEWFRKLTSSPVCLHVRRRAYNDPSGR